MNQRQFFLYSMTCEHHAWVCDDDGMKETCELTGELCEKVEDCPVLNNKEENYEVDYKKETKR